MYIILILNVVAIIILLVHDIKMLKKDAKNPLKCMKFIITLFLSILNFTYFLHYNLIIIIAAIIARIVLVPINNVVESKQMLKQNSKKVSIIFFGVILIIFFVIKISSPRIKCKIYELNTSYSSILPRTSYTYDFVWKIENIDELKNILEENEANYDYRKLINELNIDDTFFEENYLILTQATGDTFVPEINYVNYNKKNKQIRLVTRESIIPRECLNTTRFGLYAIKVNKKYDSNDIEWEIKRVLTDLT